MSSQQHPSVELGEADDSDGTGVLGLAGGFAVFAFLAVFLALPAQWEEWVVENDSRRARGILNALEGVGQVWVVAGLGVIALVCAGAAVYQWRSDRADRADRTASTSRDGAL